MRIARAEEPQQNLIESPSGALANRKLIRNAEVELEIVSFDEAVQKITAFANEEHGYVATSSSEKQANGKLRGEVVVKVLPENLDRFLQKVRGLGRIEEPDARHRRRNESVFRYRCAAEKRARDGAALDRDVENENGQGCRFASGGKGTRARARGDREDAGRIEILGFAGAVRDRDDFACGERYGRAGCVSLKERAQLALYAPEVEKIYNDIKALASPKVQITNAQLESR